MQFTKAVITGASSGIGEALARLLADQGVALIITGRDTQRLESLAAELQHKVPVTPWTIDLLNSDDLAKLLRIIQEEIPDLLINNAGAGLYGDVLTYQTAEQQQIFELNAAIPMQLTIEAARSLITVGKKGVILNVSSTAAYQPFPQFAVYAAAKGFIRDFSESFDCEVCDKGVRVLTSCPGVVATRFQERAVVDLSAKQQRYLVLTPEFAARDIWHQIQSGQAVRIFDWKYRLLTFFGQHFTPKAVVLWIIRTFFAGQLPPRNFVRAPQFQQRDKGQT